MLALTIEGTVLSLEDIGDDGRILTCMAGYTLQFRSNPFRLELSSENPYRVYTTPIIADRTEHYKNGVIHYMPKRAEPITPWLGKSNLDVLVETNQRRGRDLSTFLSCVNASSILKEKLLSDVGATTIFVPTNEAFEAFNGVTMEDFSDDILNTTSLLYKLLLNHFVTGNFATRAWKTIPTGTKVSETKLNLGTHAGNTLTLEILDSTVTINGFATIVQQDIFSQYGIVHIIDRPLTLLEPLFRTSDVWDQP
jgi:uncharacterized surface protein with fasciclin (FAS1) repeats